MSTIRDHSTPYNQTCGLNMGGGLSQISQSAYQGSLPPEFEGVETLEVSTRTSGLKHPFKHPPIEQWEPAAIVNLARMIKNE